VNAWGGTPSEGNYCYDGPRGDRARVSVSRHEEGVPNETCFQWLNRSKLQQKKKGARESDQGRPILPDRERYQSEKRKGERANSYLRPLEGTEVLL